MDAFWEFVKNHLVFIIGGLGLAVLGIHSIYEEIANFWGCEITEGEIKDAKLKYDGTYSTKAGNYPDYKYVHYVLVGDKIYTTKNKTRFKRRVGRQVKVFFNKKKRRCELVSFWFLPGYLAIIALGIIMLVKGFK